MQLKGTEKARYFIATTICAYLAALCLALIITSAFFSQLSDALAMTATGVFGLLVCASLGFAFFWSQRRELQYEQIDTEADAATNFNRIRAAVLRSGWRILAELPDRQLDAQTPDSRFSAGERVQIRCKDSIVWVASICDPSVGFSLTGRQRCAENRAAVRSALLPSAIEPS
jgi:hypothetical protein